MTDPGASGQHDQAPTGPARLSPGELLAALGELDCARVAQVYAEVADRSLGAAAG